MREGPQNTAGPLGEKGTAGVPEADDFHLRGTGHDEPAPRDLPLPGSAG